MTAAAAAAPFAKFVREFAVALLAPGVVVLVELAHLVGAPLVVFGVVVHSPLAAAPHLAAAMPPLVRPMTAL